MAQGIERGGVYLCSFPPPDKQRPALVLTRSSAVGLLNTVTIAPVTSAIRDTSSAVRLDEGDGMKSPCSVNLHNTITIQQKRLGRRVATLSEARMKQVCVALRFALGCD